MKIDFANNDKINIWEQNAGRAEILPDSITQGIWVCGDSIIDVRDGQIYNTVQIGTQCWMAENLNIGINIDGSISQSDNGTIEKYCYLNDPAYCDTL